MRSRPYTETNPNTSDKTWRRIDYTMKSTRPDIYGPDTSSTTYADMNSPRWWYRNESGSRNEGWRDAIRRKSNANSALTLNITDFQGESGAAYARVKKWVSGGWLQYEKTVPYGLTFIREPAAPDHSALYDSALNAAKERLVSRIREVQTAFQGGVYLGEARETVRMLTGGVKGIAQGLSTYLSNVSRAGIKLGSRHSFRRLPPERKFEKVSGIIADQWLGFQYGVRPFVADVKSAAEAVARLDYDINMDDKVVLRVLETRRASNIVDVGTGGEQWTNSDVSSGGSPTIPIRWRLRDDKELRLSLRAQVRANREGTRGALQYLGLSFQDFAPTIWELIPYSMVLDYFTNVGKIVDAASLYIVNVDWCWRTRIDRTTRVYDAFDLKDQVFHSNYATWPEREIYFLVRPWAKYNRTKVVRENHGGNLIPSLQLKLPGVKDWRKWANMSALARKSNAVSFGLQKLLGARAPW